LKINQNLKYKKLQPTAVTVAQLACRNIKLSRLILRVLYIMRISVN